MNGLYHNTIRFIKESLNLEDLAFPIFFIFIEPILPRADLNAIDSSSPDAPAMALLCLASGIVAWLLALTRGSTGGKLPPEPPRSEAGFRVFVLFFAAVIIEIGGEYAGFPLAEAILGAGGIALSMGAWIFAIIKPHRLPVVPAALRRVLLIPFMAALSYMTAASVGVHAGSDILTMLIKALTAFLLFWIMVFPVRCFSESGPFSVRIWLFRMVLFVAGYALGIGALVD